MLVKNVFIYFYLLNEKHPKIDFLHADQCVRWPHMLRAQVHDKQIYASLMRTLRTIW